MSIAFNPVDIFTEDILKGNHDFDSSGHTFKAALSNTQPLVTDAVWADITEIAAGNGYTAGGADIQNTLSQTGGVTTINGTDIVWTASGGSIGPFQFVILYNDTQTTPVKPICGWYDYGSAQTILDTKTFTLDILTNIFTL